MNNEQKKVDIGKRLAGWRNQIGISSEEMAMSLGITLAEYIGMKSGEVR